MGRIGLVGRLGISRLFRSGLGPMVVLAVSLSGCGSSGGIAGTYHARSSPRRIIVNSDGTFRMMYGERTSPSDVMGTYKETGDTIRFTPYSASTSPAIEAHSTADGFTIGQESFSK